MKIESFYDDTTSTLTYLVYDANTRTGIVIDPVRDFDPNNARTSWASCERVTEVIDRERLEIAYVIDTHAHADHMTGLPYFRDRYGARTVTGKKIPVVQKAFSDFYNLGDAVCADGSQFDVLLEEGDALQFGGLTLDALHTPGHTPAHMSWRVGEAIFLGDTLFTPDYGAARCDFPGGSASELYASVQRLYAYPDDTRLFVDPDETVRASFQDRLRSRLISEHERPPVKPETRTRDGRRIRLLADPAPLG